MLKKKYLSLSLMFLLVLSLGLFCTSYTMAYSFDDFLEYCTLVKNGTIGGASNALKTVCTNVLNNANNIRNSVNIDNYSSFVACYSSMDPNVVLECYTGTTNFKTASPMRSSGYTSVKRFGLYSNRIGSQGNDSYINAFSWSGNVIGLVNGTWTGGEFGPQKYFYINILPRDNLKTSNLPWYIADAFVGSNYSSAVWGLQDVNNQVISANLQILESSANNGKLYQIEIADTQNLINGEYYKLKLTNGSTIYTSSQFQLQWENDTSGGGEDASGDTGGGGVCMCGPILLQILDKLSGDVITAIDNNGNIISGSLSEIGEQIQNNNKALNDIKNVLTGSGDSGDGILGGTELESGEEPTLEDLPSIDIAPEDDPSNEFFTWLLNQIISVLEDDSEQTLVIPIYKTNYEIRSDVFKLEIEPLRTFIQAGWWFIVGVPFLKYIRRCIEKLKGGEIPASDDKSDLLGNVL